VTHEAERAQYDEDCAKHERPWELWAKWDLDEWVQCSSHPLWFESCHYCRIQHKELELGQVYLTREDKDEDEAAMKKIHDYFQSGEPAQSLQALRREAMEEMKQRMIDWVDDGTEWHDANDVIAALRNAPIGEEGE